VDAKLAQEHVWAGFSSRLDELYKEAAGGRAVSVSKGFKEIAKMLDPKKSKPLTDIPKAKYTQPGALASSAHRKGHGLHGN
jgi:hypothetical protein